MGFGMSSHSMLDLVYYGWPYLGLVIAAVVAALLFRERPETGRSRWADPAWAAGWVGPVYLLHQFEEHGIDLLGRRYAFLGEICRTLGYGNDCALDPSFVIVVNIGLVWVGSLVAWFYRRKRPLLGVIMWGVPLINALAHIRAGVLLDGYNAGLATAIVLFLPGTAWVVWTGLRAKTLRLLDVLWVVLAGVLVHVVLIASAVARNEGSIGHGSLLLANGLNVLIPIGMAVLLGKPRGAVQD